MRCRSRGRRKARSRVGADQAAPPLVDSVKYTCGVGHAAAHVRHDDPVRGVRTGGRAVGDVDAGRGRRSLRAPATPSIDRPTLHRVERHRAAVTGPATGHGLASRCGRRRRTSTSARTRRWSADDTVPIAEHVGRRHGCRCGPCSRPSGLRWALLAAAVDWCCVQVVPPSCETATTQRRGRRVGRLLLPAEARPAQVHGAEERAARSVVGPDLLLVGEGGGRLLATITGADPGILGACAAAASRRRCARPRSLRSP